jgi:DNA-binding GntR family transcriptional regulator
MTEDQNTNAESPIEEEQGTSPVFEEFQALGQELAGAFNALWDHEDSVKLRHELRDGFTELGRQFDTAIQSASESQAAQQFGEQIRETVDRARESDVASKVEEGVLLGLRELNAQVSRFVNSIESTEAAEAEAEAEADLESEA